MASEKLGETGYAQTNERLEEASVFLNDCFSVNNLKAELRHNFLHLDFVNN